MASTVAVFSPNWLGDAVMALPALGAVGRRPLGARVVVVARANLAPLFELAPGVDLVVPIGVRAGFLGRLSVAGDAQRVAAAGAEVAILLPNSFRSAVVAWRARVPERWGYRTDARRWLLTRAAPRPGGSRHQSAYYLELMRALGMPAADNATLDPIPIPEAAREEARRHLEREGLAGDKPIVGLAPGAAYGHAKRWPPERFAALALELAGRAGASSILVGSRDDREAAAEVERALDGRLASGGGSSLMPRCLNLVGRTTLGQLVGLMAHMRAFVSNDSGAMHLAAACGLPVTALFGSTNERETAPMSFGSAAPPHTVLSVPVWCRPCMLRECPIDHRCMRAISARDAAESVLRHLEPAGGS